MKLTGKCKEDFEKWYESKDNDKYYLFTKEFYALHPSMQYGVYQDFFKKHSEIWIELTSITHTVHIIRILGKDIMSPFYEFEPFTEFEGSYDEARQKAIEKANEIYNANKEQ
jgi:hypothetical protein